MGSMVWSPSLAVSFDRVLVLVSPPIIWTYGAYQLLRLVATPILHSVSTELYVPQVSPPITWLGRVLLLVSPPITDEFCTLGV